MLHLAGRPRASSIYHVIVREKRAYPWFTSQQASARVILAQAIKVFVASVTRSCSRGGVVCGQQTQRLRLAVFNYFGSSIMQIWHVGQLSLERLI